MRLVLIGIYGLISGRVDLRSAKNVVEVDMFYGSGLHRGHKLIDKVFGVGDSGERDICLLYRFLVLVQSEGDSARNCRFSICR
jgi:hypothetical protein